MLWAVPAKSPVAPRALAVLAFFLLLTLYLTWPPPLRMGSGLSTNPDSLLNFWAMAWSYHILPLQPLSLFDVNIFSRVRILWRIRSICSVLPCSRRPSGG